MYVRHVHRSRMLDHNERLQLSPRGAVCARHVNQTRIRFTGARRTRTRHASRCLYTVAKTHSERVGLFDTRMAAFCMQSSRSSFSPTLPNMSAFSMPTDTYTKPCCQLYQLTLHTEQQTTLAERNCIRTPCCRSCSEATFIFRFDWGSRGYC